MKKILGIILVVLFIGHLGFRVYEYRESYTTPFDPSYWKNAYDHSQWSTKSLCNNLDPHINPHTCVWDDNWYRENKDNPNINSLKRNAIGDDGLYTYAGWEYIHGHDPTTLNAEIPPFGKYLIGLSEVVFRNQNIFTLLAGLFALYALYLVSSTIFKDRFIAFIPVALFSFEPLFYTQLKAPYLDLLYLSLLSMTFYFLLKKKYIASSIFLGLMAATKSAVSTFPLGILVVLSYLVIAKKRHEIKYYLYSLPIAFITFLLTYTKYFLDGHSFLDFLGVQKWIMHFYASGANGSFSSVWEMVFTGTYANWWGQKTTVSEWHIGWIILVLLSMYAVFKLIKTEKHHLPILLVLWVFTYLLFLCFVPVWPRYLLLVLPFMYTISVAIIVPALHHPNENKR